MTEQLSTAQHSALRVWMDSRVRLPGAESQLSSDSSDSCVSFDNFLYLSVPVSVLSNGE